MDIEAAKFRALLDELFHSLPITNEMPEHTRAIVGKLRRLVYENGKQSVIDARKIIEVESEPSVR